MPFARDTLTALIDKTLADIAARLTGANPFLRRSVLNVLGRVLAAMHNDELGYLDWQARMAIPVTARGEYIDMWAALKGVYRKAPAFASGTATIAGGTPGTIVSIGVELTRSDGVLYQIGTGVTLDGSGNGTVSLAAEAAGNAGNASPGGSLSFVSPISGVPSTATIVTMTGGADLETDAAFSSRMLQVYRSPPQGGDLDDYIAWALEVPEVTRAWAGGPAIMGAGSVTVYFMVDDANHPSGGLPIGTNGVSQYETRDSAAAGDQLLVANHIFLKRAVTALVYAAAPVGDPLNLTLSEVPVDTTIRAGITAALSAFLIREASPGGVVLPDLSSGGTVRLSHLESALAAVPALDHFVLVSPAADVTVATGHISIPGVISYI